MNACTRAEAAFLTVLLIAPVFCWADWVSVGRSGSCDITIEDRELRVVNGLLRTWIQWSCEREDKTPTGITFQSLKELGLIDCKGKRSGVMQITYYSQSLGNGKVVDTFSKPANSVNIVEHPPGSIGAEIITVACDTHRKTLKPAGKRGKQS